MSKVIIDTCTFGRIIKEEEGAKIVENILKDKNFIMIDFRIVRDELRRGPKKALEIYDDLIKGDRIQDSKQISNLAAEYFDEYKKKGGVVGEKKLKRDFKIIACASIKNCDVVYSEDDKTMKCVNARAAYILVNLSHHYRNPLLHSYRELKQRYLTD
jgi:predicted nucleic acid-binding protein